MRWLLLVFTASMALAAPALSAAEEKKPAPNPTVLMSPLALPVIVDGRLVNYIFVTFRLGLGDKADAAKLRIKEPYFRDALVRAGHRTPFVRQDTYTALDDDKMKAALLREAVTIAGPGMVLSAQIIREQPQHIDGLPKPKSPPTGR